MTAVPCTPDGVASVQLDPTLIATLDDAAMALSLNAASDDDRPGILAEIERRGLDV